MRVRLSLAPCDCRLAIRKLSFLGVAKIISANGMRRDVPRLPGVPSREAGELQLQMANVRSPPGVQNPLNSGRSKVRMKALSHLLKLAEENRFALVASFGMAVLVMAR